jgi:hypothetical protein
MADYGCSQLNVGSLLVEGHAYRYLIYANIIQTMRILTKLESGLEVVEECDLDVSDQFQG